MGLDRPCGKLFCQPQRHVCTDMCGQQRICCGVSRSRIFLVCALLVLTPLSIEAQTLYQARVLATTSEKNWSDTGSKVFVQFNHFQGWTDPEIFTTKIAKGETQSMVYYVEYEPTAIRFCHANVVFFSGNWIYQHLTLNNVDLFKSEAQSGINVKENECVEQDFGLLSVPFPTATSVLTISATTGTIGTTAAAFINFGTTNGQNLRFNFFSQASAGQQFTLPFYFSSGENPTTLEFCYRANNKWRIAALAIGGFSVIVDFAPEALIGVYACKSFVVTTSLSHLHTMAPSRPGDTIAPTAGLPACVCKGSWISPILNCNSNTHVDCPMVPCDGSVDGRWCMVANAPCRDQYDHGDVSHGGAWAQCGRTLAPTSSPTSLPTNQPSTSPTHSPNAPSPPPTPPPFVLPAWWFSTIEATTTNDPQASSSSGTSSGGVAAAVIVCLLLLFVMIGLTLYFRKKWSNEAKEKGDSMVFNYANQPQSNTAYLTPIIVGTSGTSARGVTAGNTLATYDDNQYEVPVAMNPRYASVPNNRVTPPTKYNNNHNNTNHNNHNNINNNNNNNKNNNKNNKNNNKNNKKTNNNNNNNNNNNSNCGIGSTSTSTTSTTSTNKILRLKGPSVVKDEEETFEEDGFYDNVDDDNHHPAARSRSHSFELEKNIEYESMLQPQYAVPT